MSLGIRDSRSVTNSQLEIPEWLQGIPQDLATGVIDLLEQPLLTGDERVADLQGQHIEASNLLADYATGQGADSANALIGAGQDSLGGLGLGQDALTSVLGQGPATNNGVNLDNVNSYINNDVLNGQIDAASRDVVRNFSEGQAPASRLAQALSGGTGSTRGAIGDAILQRGAEDRLGDIASQFRSNAYGQALNIGANEAAQNASLQNAGLDRSLNAGNSLIDSARVGADLLGQGSQQQLGNFGALSASGDIQRSYEQALLDVNQDNYLQQWRNQQQANAQINGDATTFGNRRTETIDTISTHEWLQGINDSVAQWGGAIAASDERLKTNIQYVETHNGHRFYSFNWPNGQPGFGVIAQEVQKTNPELVHEVNGALTVEYAGLY